MIEPPNTYDLDPTELHATACDRDERTLLGACLRDAAACVEVIALVPVQDLYRRTHQVLLELLIARIRSSQGVDLVDVCGALADDRALAERCGGIAYVAELPEHAPSSAIDLRSLAARIRARWACRELLAVGEALRQVGSRRQATLDGDVVPEDPHAAAAHVARHLDRLGEPPQRSESTLGEALERAVTLREEARAAGRPRTRRTGHRPLDDLLDGGLRPGELVIVAGRPGAGKTAYGLGMALEVARAGGRVGVVSLEMSREELADRLLSTASSTPLSEIRRGLRDVDLADWRAYLAALDLRIDAPTGITPAGLGSLARRWWSRGLDLLVVDYLQLVRHDSAERNDLRVGATATSCKVLARELQIPVVLLSQLSRDVERRRASSRPREQEAEHWWDDVELPRLADLRDSGQIEQDADLVLFPLRAEPYGILRANGEPDRNAAAIVVAKQRNGRTGTVPIAWHGPTASYRCAP